MGTNFGFAQAVQAGFWISGFSFLVITYTGFKGALGMVSAMSLCIVFFIVAMTLKCRACGVSFYFDLSINSWNISGINLFKPVKKECPKCGALRDRE